MQCQEFPLHSAWISAAAQAKAPLTNTLVANAELAGIDSATAHLLFASLRVAEARGKSRTAAPVATPPPATAATTAVPPTPAV